MTKNNATWCALQLVCLVLQYETEPLVFADSLTSLQAFFIVSHNFFSFSEFSNLMLFSIHLGTFPSCFLLCASKLWGSLNLEEKINWLQTYSKDIWNKNLAKISKHMPKVKVFNVRQTLCHSLARCIAYSKFPCAPSVLPLCQNSCCRKLPYRPWQVVLGVLPSYVY